MDAIKNFLKTTVVGGILFLVPLLVLLIVFRHAFGLVGKMVHPLLGGLPQYQMVKSMATGLAKLESADGPGSMMYLPPERVRM